MNTDILVDALARDYTQNVPVKRCVSLRSLAGRDAPPATARLQERIYDALFGNDQPWCKFAPAAQYQRTFLKAVLNWVERRAFAANAVEQEEVLEALLEKYLALQENDGPAETTYRWYPCKWGTAIGIKEHVPLICRGTTGLRTWPASLRLAELLAAHPQWVEDARVLELGAGAGFLACFTAALPLVKAVCATDVDPGVLEQLGSNASFNARSDRAPVATRRLSWNAPTSDIVAIGGDATLVLGADLAYDPTLAAPLAHVLAVLLAHPEASARRALLTMAVRDPATAGAFVDAIRAALPPAVSFECAPVAPDAAPALFYRDEVDCPVWLISLTSASRVVSSG